MIIMGGYWAELHFIQRQLDISQAGHSHVLLQLISSRILKLLSLCMCAPLFHPCIILQP